MWWVVGSLCVAMDIFIVVRSVKRHARYERFDVVDQLLQLDTKGSQNRQNISSLPALMRLNKLDEWQSQMRVELSATKKWHMYLNLSSTLPWHLPELWGPTHDLCSTYVNWTSFSWGHRSRHTTIDVILNNTDRMTSSISRYGAYLLSCFVV